MGSTCRARIVCTIGPVTGFSEQVQALVDTGIDVARINRSHGKPEEHEAAAQKIRKTAATSSRAVAVLVGLQGPKIRLETFEEGLQALEARDTFTITTRTIPGTKELVSTVSKGLPDDCVPGDRLLIDNGSVAVRVVEVTEAGVVIRVEVPGTMSDHKNLDLPGVAVSVPAPSEEDKEDLCWGLKQDADFITFSFIRSTRGINGAHAIMDEVGRHIPVIAKIEKPQTVGTLPEIVDAFDGIVVARGDPGVGMPLESAPLTQKRTTELVRRAAKPAIVATQVMSSVIKSPHPTRAEASDCTDAILDGADTIMLSGETSAGASPTEAVRTTAHIIESTEENGGEMIAGLSDYYDNDRAVVICEAAASIVEHLDSRHLVAFTQLGTSVRRMSRLRRPIPTLAFTPLESTRHRLALAWSIRTYRAPEVRHTDDMTWQVDQVAQPSNSAEIGDELVIIAGVPLGTEGSLNLLRVHEVSDEVDYTINGTINS